MKKANKVKDMGQEDLAASYTNQLTVIIGVMDNIRDGCYKDKKGIGSALNLMNKSCQKLGAIIEQIEYDTGETLVHRIRKKATHYNELKQRIDDYSNSITANQDKAEEKALTEVLEEMRLDRWGEGVYKPEIRNCLQATLCYTELIEMGKVSGNREGLEEKASELLEHAQNCRDPFLSLALVRFNSSFSRYINAMDAGSLNGEVKQMKTRLINIGNLLSSYATQEYN